mgnify:CR=1 FL=1
MDLKKLKSGKKPEDGEINVLVEIPMHSKIKYELDKDSGFIIVDRFLHTAMTYPTNYGFIPNTLADDGDPVDVMVLSDAPVAPGTVIPAIVIGMLEMEDEEGIDTKILAVPSKKVDPLYGDFKDASEIPDANYKTLEPGKWGKLKEWEGKKEAIEEVKKGIALFKKKKK